MPCFICETCGTQYAESATPPVQCPVCEDERQYVGWNGQRWTTHAELARWQDGKKCEEQWDTPRTPHFALHTFSLHHPARARRNSDQRRTAIPVGPFTPAASSRSV